MCVITFYPLSLLFPSKWLFLFLSVPKTMSALQYAVVVPDMQSEQLQIKVNNYKSKQFNSLKKRTTIIKIKHKTLLQKAYMFLKNLINMHDNSNLLTFILNYYYLFNYDCMTIIYYLFNPHGLHSFSYIY